MPFTSSACKFVQNYIGSLLTPGGVGKEVMKGSARSFIHTPYPCELLLWIMNLGPKLGGMRLGVGK